MKNYLICAATAAFDIAGTAPALAQSAAKKPAAKTVAAKSGGAVSAARIGGKPNLNGIWRVMAPADWNLEPHDAVGSPAAPELLGALAATPGGLGVVDGDAIPYKPEALAQRDKNRRAAPKADPEAACYLPGIPRATYVANHSFQIIQAEKGDMLFAYEYAGANRAVFMKPVEVPPIDTWMGTSYGQWEGDVLKITTLAQNGMTWLDRSGNFASGGATVVERFKLLDATHLDYTATIDDPDTYTKPWKIHLVLYKNIEPNAHLMDFNCVPFADEVVYGDLKPKDNKQ